MRCPECGAECDRDEVDNGVGIVASPWSCSCGWDEDQLLPMGAQDWDRWLSEDEPN